ncbi:MAG: metallophosphoesterase family protein [bacterium]|nr:MAG: metallophosphoesterase family protein [bacterium]
MRIGILSDIHSNLEALEAVDEALSSASVDTIYFAGDVVGYGPDPNPCTQWVRDRAEIAVAGNHDFAAIGMMDPETFNSNAREAIIWNSERLEDWAGDYLKELPMVVTRDEVTIVHASPRAPELWEYIFTLWDAEVNFSHFLTEFCFVGHSHQPVMVGMDPEGVVTVIPGESLKAEEGHRYLINVGSVGQPRDGNPDACCGILDTSTFEFTLVRIPYDVRKTQRKMVKEGLPLALVDRLSEGR